MYSIMVFILLQSAGGGYAGQRRYDFEGDLVGVAPDDVKAQTYWATTRAIDEKYNMDSAPILHKKWQRYNNVGWYVDCDSLPQFRHVVYNKQMDRLEWGVLDRNQSCTSMRYMVYGALHEWLAPLSEYIGHEPSVGRDSVRISFEDVVHGRCVFDSPRVLAHANEQFIHFNRRHPWCVMGSKTPNYIWINNGNGYYFDAGYPGSKYGRALNAFTRSMDNCMNVYATLVHEMGHVLGLNHASRTTSLMYPSAVDHLNYVHASDATFMAQLFRN